MKNSLMAFVFASLLSIGLASCNTSQKKGSASEDSLGIRAKVDNEVNKLNSLLKGQDVILQIDHARLAEQAGVYTPPSIVTIFSDGEVNSALLQLDPLVGLDLPYKVLCYSEPDTSKASIAFTSSDFLRKRHGLSESDVYAYKKGIETVMQSFSKADIVPTDLEKVHQNFGIISLQSSHDFSTTIELLKNSIMAQGDTKWFGEIDFQQEAKEAGVTIGKTTLLLFGGPAPGGMAMVSSPKLGLDAFCQKLLIYENESGETTVAFNDIPAFAELYYGNSTKPQQVINERLKATFSNAIAPSGTEE